MAKKQRGDNVTPKSSAELVREAREAFSGTGDEGSEASHHLLEGARDWLGSIDQYEAAAPHPRPEPADSPLASDTQAEFEAMLEPPPSRPRPSRPRPRTAPLPPRPGVPAKKRRTVVALALGIGAIALLSNVAGLLVSEDSDQDGNTPEEEQILETSSFSEGSISSASDPCSGATIGGDLEAVITYYADTTTAKVAVTITGSRLEGSDGSIYTVEIFGQGIGTPGQETFVFDSERMVMSRDDGVEFSDTATFTIEIVDGEPDNWSYTTSGAVCDS